MGSPNGRGRVRVREVSSRFMSPNPNPNPAAGNRKLGRSVDKENHTPIAIPNPDPVAGNRKSGRSLDKENHTPTPIAIPTATTGGRRCRHTPAAKLLQDATRLDQDPHSLKLLYNRHLQWRFINAKARASMLSAKMDTEGQLYSAAIKLSDMRDSVKRRRTQLQTLLTAQASSTVAECQMPYLEQWCGLEEAYSASLCEAADAFKCLSVRLPVGQGVKVDVRGLGEALESAQSSIQLIIGQTRGYMASASQVEGLASQVARVAAREGAHIHDSGYSLATVYAQQVEEWCLRGHLIRLHSQ